MSAYVKTPKGIEEMNNRTAGLSPKLRRVLIMVDGKRDIPEITEMFPGEDASSLLATLYEQGFITPLNAPAPDATPASQPVTKVEAPLDEAQRFIMAKNLMINTIKTFVGGMGSGLINQIEKCTTLEQLRPHFKVWSESISMTRDGRKQAAELEKNLAALLS